MWWWCLMGKVRVCYDECVILMLMGVRCSVGVCSRMCCCCCDLLIRASQGLVCRINIVTCAAGNLGCVCPADRAGIVWWEHACLCWSPPPLSHSWSDLYGLGPAHPGWMDCITSIVIQLAVGVDRVWMGE